MTTSNLALLDSNILIYSHQAHSKFHVPSRDLLEKALKGDLNVCICPQVLMEFYAVITNPKRVTNPVDSKQATMAVMMFLKAKRILKIFPKEDTIDITLNLLEKYSVRDRKIFDLQLVATMISNNVTNLYTYNFNDFTEFKEIEVLSP
jgi:toxin-antitoxin system PIN domain toxin